MLTVLARSRYWSLRHRAFESIRGLDMIPMADWSETNEYQMRQLHRGSSMCKKSEFPFVF